MPVSQQLRDRALADVHIIPWELSVSLWGVAIEFDSGSTILEKVGTKAQAEQRVLDILKDADRVF